MLQTRLFQAYTPASRGKACSWVYTTGWGVLLAGLMMAALPITIVSVLLASMPSWRASSSAD
jgi:ABC-type glycerol-3-phosphate transport system permease component